MSRLLLIQLTSSLVLWGSCICPGLTGWTGLTTELALPVTFGAWGLSSLLLPWQLATVLQAALCRGELLRPTGYFTLSLALSILIASLTWGSHLPQPAWSLLILIGGGLQTLAFCYVCRTMLNTTLPVG